MRNCNKKGRIYFFSPFLFVMYVPYVPIFEDILKNDKPGETNSTLTHPSCVFWTLEVVSRITGGCSFTTASTWTTQAWNFDTMKTRWFTVNGRKSGKLTSVEVGSCFFPIFYKVFIHPRWCRICSINSIGWTAWVSTCLGSRNLFLLLMDVFFESI